LPNLFTDENHHSSASVFASTVKFHSNKPILLLEEFEDYFTNVQCVQNGIDLSFSSGDAVLAAMTAWEESGEAIVVSSHHGCNENGERVVYTYVWFLIMAVVMIIDSVQS
jgi:hypothetical protein